MPHENVVGVQLCVSAGAAVVDAVPELAATTQVPVRVWVRPVPQPVAGAHEAYCHEAEPPEQLPNPDAVQANVQVE